MSTRRSTQRPNERSDEIPFNEDVPRQHSSAMRKINNITTSLLISIAIPMVCSGVMMVMVNPYMTSGRMLKKPRWAMLGDVKGVWYGVFMICSMMMGCASWVVYKTGSPIKKKIMLGLYTLQLLMNLMWLPLVFYFHNIEAALIDSYLLLIVVMVCTHGFGNVNNVAGYMMLPYSICAHILAVYSTHLYILN